MKLMDEHVLFYHVVGSNVRSHWNVKDLSLHEIFLRNHNEAHYTIWKSHTVYTSFFFVGCMMLLYLTVSGSVEPIKEMKFVMF